MRKLPVALPTALSACSTLEASVACGGGAGCGSFGGRGAGDADRVTLLVGDGSAGFRTLRDTLSASARSRSRARCSRSTLRVSSSSSFLSSSESDTVRRLRVLSSRRGASRSVASSHRARRNSSLYLFQANATVSRWRPTCMHTSGTDNGKTDCVMTTYAHF